MSRKKKSEGKLKAAETEAVVPAAEAKPTRLAPAAPPEKAEVASEATESKASEVIPPVAIALLEAHPQLPDGAAILASFAEHYRESLERAAAAALAPPEPPPEPEPTRESKRTGPQPRPALHRTPVAPPTLATMPPPPPFEPAPTVVVVEDEVTLAPPPDLATLAPPEHATDADALFAEPESAVFAEDAELFGDKSAASEDDIFASLGGASDAGTSDAGFTASSDYSDPFIRADAPATSGGSDLFAASEIVADAEAPAPLFAEPEERTTAIAAFEDVESAPVEEAAPTDRTTMIQAMPDDEPGEAAEGNGDDSPKTGRKSRKSKKKK